jgi:hypothetical protein
MSMSLGLKFPDWSVLAQFCRSAVPGANRGETPLLQENSTNRGEMPRLQENSCNCRFNISFLASLCLCQIYVSVAEWKPVVMIRVCLVIVMLLATGTSPADDAYQSQEDFLLEAFSGVTPDPGVIWLKGDVKNTASDILGHPYPGLRIRYWGEGTRTAWILEEIGKVKPITVGLVVNDDGLETIRVLAFRESRGWEVRYPFFTDQFSGIGLTDDHDLNRPIDGISGATLSVRALKKLARLALYLHGQTRLSDDTTS